MIDKSALLAGFLPEDDVVLPSGAGTVRVRGLSRNEAVATQKGMRPDDDASVAAAEATAVSFGLLEPRLSLEEVLAWRETALAADFLAVANRISGLSNMDPQGGKGPTSSSRRTRS